MQIRQDSQLKLAHIALLISCNASAQAVQIDVLISYIKNHKAAGWDRGGGASAMHVHAQHGVGVATVWPCHGCRVLGLQCKKLIVVLPPPAKTLGPIPPLPSRTAEPWEDGAHQSTPGLVWTPCDAPQRRRARIWGQPPRALSRGAPSAHHWGRSTTMVPPNSSSNYGMH
eukprot:361663-Chlamydomonas_euryale.AAC.3